MSKGSGTTRSTNSKTAHAKIAGSYGFNKLGSVSSSMGWQGVVSDYSHNPTGEQMVKYANQYLSHPRFNKYPNKGYGVDMAKEIAKDLQARGAGVYAVKNKATLKNINGDLVNLSLGRDLKWKAKVSTAYKSNQKQSTGSVWIDAMNKKKAEQKKKNK